MMVFALGMHWQGVLGVPRRAHLSNLAPNLAGTYNDVLIPRILTGISGIILLVAVITYFTVLFGTIFSSKKLEDKDVPEIPFSSSANIRSEGIMKVLDNIYAWFAVAVLLVIVAYLPTLIDLFANQVLSPGFRLW
jgi:cytochrome c oxidase subunit I